MSTREDLIKAIKFEHPRHIPVSAGILPAAWMKYRRDLDELLLAHPILFSGHEVGARDYDAVGGTYVVGEHVDAWGCVWTNLHSGMESMVLIFGSTS